uniref:Chaperone binding protein n=1 Tax=Riptortus pedestris TaxID=329032 RepID=R4WIP6_RIPPE|nr:chaperone binding protein [Riptortus pedestris]
MSASAGESTSLSSNKEEGCDSKPQATINCKLDWYQTETQVVLSVLAKNIDSDKLSIIFGDSEIDLRIVFKDGMEHNQTIHLYHDIVSSGCTFKVLSTKIEMKLPKKLGLHWPSLEKEVKLQPKKTERNWDKVVSEIEDDKLEGEAVLNALFQKIYNEGSDEVKKAMNKSFLESGGTELNTNWDAVSKGKVSVKPPEGMEWRSWEK